MELHLWLTPSTGKLLKSYVWKSVGLLEGLGGDRKFETMLQLFLNTKQTKK